MYLRIFGNDIYVLEIPWYLPFGDIVYLAIVGDFLSFCQIMKYHDFDGYHDFMSCHEITISRYHDIDDIVMMSWFWMSSIFHDVDVVDVMILEMMSILAILEISGILPFFAIFAIYLIFTFQNTHILSINHVCIRYPLFGPCFWGRQPRAILAILGGWGVIFGNSEIGLFLKLLTYG